MTEAIRLSEPEMLEGQEGERTDVVQFLTYEAGYGNPDAQVTLPHHTLLMLIFSISNNTIFKFKRATVLKNYCLAF